MEDDLTDTDEFIDIGGPEHLIQPNQKKRRGAPRDDLKKTVFFPVPAPLPSDPQLVIVPYSQLEKLDSSAFPSDMISRIIANSRAHVEKARQELEDERIRIERERTRKQKEIMKAAEAEIQQKIEAVKQILADKDANRSAAPVDVPERPGTPGMNPNDLSISSSSTAPPAMLPTGLTEPEQEIINLRVRLQQLQFAEYERKENQKKVKIIWEIHPHLTEEEALRALKDCGNDEEEAITQLTDWSWLRELRIKLAREKTPVEEETSTKKRKRSVKAKSGSAALSRAKRTAPAKKASIKMPVVGSQVTKEEPGEHGQPAAPAADGSAPNEAWPEGAEGSEMMAVDEDGEMKVKKKKKVQVPKLRLDDAVAQATQQGSMDGWSQARIRAWNLRDSNPNAYYYRFNDPGEEQRNGKWTEDEKKAFFKRMAEVGVNGQWGIFAKAISGRVGYQCANFYRQLIETGEIQDERYVIDETGKAHFLFSKGVIKKGKNKGDGTEGGEDGLQPSTEGDVETPKPPPKKKRKTASDEPSAKKTAAKKVAVNPPEEPPKSAMVPITSVAMMEGVVATSEEGAAAVKTEEVAASTDGAPAKKKRAPSKKSGSAPAKKGSSSRKRKKVNDDDDDCDDDYRPSSKTADALQEEVEAKKQKLREENPLPGLMDSITLEEVVEPAISPYGHVLSYSTWISILMKEPKNTCPFTKQPLKKRDLVVLNWDNIDQYRDKIIRQ